MGHWTAIGMRDAAPTGSLCIDTCAVNDSSARGSARAWTWANPTNRAIRHDFGGVSAVSVECLWQGTKAIRGQPCPDLLTLAGAWRRGKKRRPVGSWSGELGALITDPGEARRRIYIPAYERLIAHWLMDEEVLSWIEAAHRHPGPVFLRDWDTGRGVDRNAPMSHAWVLAVWLNTGRFPS